MYGYLRDAIVECTQRTMGELIDAAEAVPIEKHDWRPMGEARTVLELVQECAEVNGRWSEILTERQWKVRDSKETQQYYCTMPDLPAAISRLRESTAQYVQAIRSVPYEKLSEELELPWGTVKMADALLHSFWHMSYHAGQINYIQTLYGDWEEH